MSSRGNNSRPVYVPSHKRKRFHGAFTGGFSAGHFNTVGSKEGWKPRNARDVQQRMEDYMDEDDHDQWGGPKAVKQEFVTQVKESHEPKSVSTFQWVQPPQGVGARLLRMLGWRDGSTAYVPTDSATFRTDENDTAQMVLSQKKLRKIQLQQVLVKLPAPKLDSAGLGYDVYRNAPEFQAHRDKRQHAARRRTHQASTGGCNVYRLSSLNGEDDSKVEQSLAAQGAFDDSYLSQETLQDFVGTKSVGGFALREDDDDVYDDKPLPSSKNLKINKNEYNTEIVDSDQDSADDQKPHAQGITSILSSWASGDSSKQADSAVTADGRAAMVGFCVGGDGNQAEFKRHVGPDLPANFRVTRHVFRHDDRPSKFHQQAQHEQAEKNRQHAFRRLTEPMASSAFASLKTAMSNRFTPTAPVAEIDPSQVAVGLYRPPKSSPKEAPEVATDKAASSSKQVKVSRSYAIFNPAPLICKRLGVPVPNHGSASRQANARSAKTDFEKQVTKLAADAKTQGGNRTTAKERILEDGSAVEPKEIDQRPAMNVYRSIFEPQSDEEEFEESGDEDVGKDDNTTSVSLAIPSAQHEPQSLHPKPSNGRFSDEKSTKKRKRKKKEKNAATSSSSDTDLDTTSTDEEERRRRRKDKKRRRRKEEKKRKKKKKSSS